VSLFGGGCRLFCQVLIKFVTHTWICSENPCASKQEHMDFQCKRTKPNERGSDCMLKTIHLPTQFGPIHLNLFQSFFFLNLLGE
jgi:hypothetical protein